MKNNEITSLANEPKGRLGFFNIGAWRKYIGHMKEVISAQAKAIGEKDEIIEGLREENASIRQRTDDLEKTLGGNLPPSRGVDLTKPIYGSNIREVNSSTPIISADRLSKTPVNVYTDDALKMIDELEGILKQFEKVQKDSGYDMTNQREEYILRFQSAQLGLLAAYIGKDGKSVAETKEGYMKLIAQNLSDIVTRSKEVAGKNVDKKYSSEASLDMVYRTPEHVIDEERNEAMTAMSNDMLKDYVYAMLLAHGVVKKVGLGEPEKRRMYSRGKNIPFGVNEKETGGIDLSNPDTLTLERILEHIKENRFYGGTVKGDFSKNDDIKSNDVYEAYKYVEELLEDLKNRSKTNDAPDELIPS